MISIDRPKCSLVAFRSLRVGFVVGDDFVVRDLRFSARSRGFPDKFFTSSLGDRALALLIRFTLYCRSFFFEFNWGLRRFSSQREGVELQLALVRWAIALVALLEKPWAAFQVVCSKRCRREKVERSMLDFACWRPHPCSERDVEEIGRLRLLPSRSDDVCCEKE